MPPGERRQIIEGERTFQTRFLILTPRARTKRMGAAAAVILMKERRIVETFERGGATSPASARTPDELGVDPHGIGWRRLRDHAVVREAGGGVERYYLDVEVWQALRRMRRRIVLVLGIVILVAALMLAASTNAAR